MTWQEFAACRGQDPELFFPVTETGAGARQAARAKAVCRECPVRQRCLDTALALSAVGVWGGTTETERCGMRRSRATAGSGVG